MHRSSLPRSRVVWPRLAEHGHVSAAPVHHTLAGAPARKLCPSLRFFCLSCSLCLQYDPYPPMWRASCYTLRPAAALAPASCPSEGADTPPPWPCVDIVFHSRMCWNFAMAKTSRHPAKSPMCADPRSRSLSPSVILWTTCNVASPAPIVIRRAQLPNWPQGPVCPYMHKR